MWKERAYLDGASKDPSVRVIQNGLVNRLDAAHEDRRSYGRSRRSTARLLWVGGTPALEHDSIQSSFAKLPLMVVILLTTTTLLMFLAFGSLVLPIKAALMSALTLGSTLGVLTWIFVDGHFSKWLNFTPTPLTAPVIGLIIAVIYGLSTDYEVFLVSRMVEARARGMPTTEAVRIGTATTGRLITAAALVLAVVAGTFVLSDLVMMKYLAFGLITALVLDATVVRMFLVPSIMKLLGDDCWWAPRWMKRLPGPDRARRDRSARRAHSGQRRPPSRRSRGSPRSPRRLSSGPARRFPSGRGGRVTRPTRWWRDLPIGGGHRSGGRRRTHRRPRRPTPMPDVGTAGDGEPSVAGISWPTTRRTPPTVRWRRRGTRTAPGRRRHRAKTARSSPGSVSCAHRARATRRRWGRPTAMTRTRRPRFPLGSNRIRMPPDAVPDEVRTASP